MLAFPVQQQRERGESAGRMVDDILNTRLDGIVREEKRLYGSDRSKAIRDLFRSLGWGKYFRVTKGCWTLGPSVEWAKGMAPAWECVAQQEAKASRLASNVWHDIAGCGCATCSTRQTQRMAVGRRVHHALNLAFGKPGKVFGSRTDTMTDYFDSDYTFHA